MTQKRTPAEIENDSRFVWQDGDIEITPASRLAGRATKDVTTAKDPAAWPEFVYLHMNLLSLVLGTNCYEIAANKV